jgi:structural maintenance of chromosome 4
LIKIREAESEFQQRTAIVAEMQSKKENIRTRIHSCQKELAQLTEDRENDVLMSLKEAKAKVEDAKQSLSNSASKSQVLFNLLKEKQANRIHGIFGRLGDLGAIPPRYDIAVTTACAALDNVVVDSTETAQKCIEYLKGANLGRATFIILEKMDKSPEKLEKIETPENIPRLIDLITPKQPMFANAFYFALHDTLVAENLEQANRAAYGKQRYRVVTIDGKLIDRSGAMTGGGTKIQRGGMNSSSSSGNSMDTMSEAELAKLEQERDLIAQELKAIQTHKANMIKNLEELEHEANQLEFQLNKVKMDYHASESMLQRLQHQLDELR